MLKVTLYILSIFDKIYQRKIIKKFHKLFNNNINTVFDVGAHNGEFIQLILNNFTANKIYSFEPSKKNYEVLKKNINNLISKKNQIYLNNFALGEVSEKKEFKQMKESSSSTISNINTISKYFNTLNQMFSRAFKNSILPVIPELPSTKRINAERPRYFPKEIKQLVNAFRKEYETTNDRFYDEVADLIRLCSSSGFRPSKEPLRLKRFQITK